jgi:hypothetical protein
MSRKTPSARISTDIKKKYPGATVLNWAFYEAKDEFEVYLQFTVGECRTQRLQMRQDVSPFQNPNSVVSSLLCLPRHETPAQRNVDASSYVNRIIAAFTRGDVEVETGYIDAICEEIAYRIESELHR